MKIATKYELEVIQALLENPQGQSTRELRSRTPALNVWEVVRGLRDNHGFRNCLLTRFIKRPEKPRYGVYYLNAEGMVKARQLLEGARTETTTVNRPADAHSSSKGGAHE